MVPRLLVAAFLSAAALPALADDVPLPELTPKGHYLVMTWDNATSSSNCIGDPKTPMCAVETVLACFVRGDHSLCQIGMGLDRDPGLGGEGPGDKMIYKIIRSGFLSGEQYPWRPGRDLSWRPGGIDMQAGDVRIDVVDRDCPGEVSEKACSPALFEIAYILRRQEGRWAVITWRPPYETRGTGGRPKILWGEGRDR
jgi:hypothetical protein